MFGTNVIENDQSWEKKKIFLFNTIFYKNNKRNDRLILQNKKYIRELIIYITCKFTNYDKINKKKQLYTSVAYVAC